MSVASRSHTAAAPTHEALHTEPVRVLAISRFSQDQLTLQRIIGHSKWVLRTTSTYAEALEILHQDRMPVVITDRDLPPYSWKDVLTELASMTNPSRLIVASDNADDRLWGEVLNLGAYDLLPKPFESAELFASVSSAWRAWKYSEAMRLHYCDKNGESVPSASLVSMAPARKTVGRAVHIQPFTSALGGFAVVACGMFIAKWRAAKRASVIANDRDHFADLLSSLPDASVSKMSTEYELLAAFDGYDRFRWKRDHCREELAKRGMS